MFAYVFTPSYAAYTQCTIHIYVWFNLILHRCKCAYILDLCSEFADRICPIPVRKVPVLLSLRANFTLIIVFIISNNNVIVIML